MSLAKLSLQRETLRRLDEAQALQAAGGLPPRDTTTTEPSHSCRLGCVSYTCP